MLKKIKKIFLFCIFILVGFSFAQNQPDSASRRTALRYLQVAKNYASKNEWTKACEASKKGNLYDKTVADLWYFIALSEYKNGSSKKAVLPIIEQAFNKKEWVDYNMNNARIFYADLLCSTGKSVEALVVLDSNPFIYSADAEYIRIKSYYQIGSKESINEARSKVDVTRKIYPQDERFAQLFFEYEYNLMFKKNQNGTGFDYLGMNENVQKIASAFVDRVPEYQNTDSELSLYAAIFSQGEKRTRLLKAFNAKGLKDEKYASEALIEGLLDEDSALDYFLNFLDKGVPLYELERFALLLQNKDVLSRLYEYLNAYNGALYCDTNGTLETNLTIFYNRGRPSKIEYDQDNNGEFDWTSDLDFGSVKVVHLIDKKIDVFYEIYPFPSKVVFLEVPGEPEGLTIFNLIDESMTTRIFDIKRDPILEPLDFFIVDENSIFEGTNVFDTEQLLASVNSIEKPSLERHDSVIRFSMLEGRPYAADYFVGDTIYAHAQFTDGENAVVRNVDTNGDGIFETTEIYAKNTNGVLVSEDEMASITQNVWGSPVMTAGIYLRMIQIDRNLDTKPDFSEEYETLGGKISSWDTDYDGAWDVRYTKYPHIEGDVLIEQTEIFVLDPVYGKMLVCVILNNGVPVLIRQNENEVSVIQGFHEKFFWIGESGAKSQEANILGLMTDVPQGICSQLEGDETDVIAVRIGENIFARLVPHQKNYDINGIDENLDDTLNKAEQNNSGVK